MRMIDQKNESVERTAEVELEKLISAESGRHKSQIDEKPEKTREVEEGKKKGGGAL